jgi:hypothetical protein
MEEERSGRAGESMRDVFDSAHYHSLKDCHVKIHDTTLNAKYFSGKRDIALGLCTDGVGPLKTRKVSCWPLVIVNYNLPPDLMFLLDYIMSLGVIPGPNKPKDSDSFLWPLTEEMLQLAKGVQVFDVLDSEYFLLRAFLIQVFSDIPAVSMLLCMTGHNGFCPCRLCSITGIRIPGQSKPYYVPHDRHLFAATSTQEVPSYDPANLPLLTQEQFEAQADEVTRAKNKTRRKNLSTKYGIKGLCILFVLGSLAFPSSFPYDFMHLIWENLIKNLVLLWTSDFKGLDDEGAGYTLADGIWAGGKATAESKQNIPSAYGAGLPDLSADGVRITAEMWSFWTLFVGPILLRRKFHDECYYLHFVELVRLLHICLKFEMTRNDIQTICEGFVNWVKHYEE